MPSFRSHLKGVIAQWSDLVEAGDFEEVDNALDNRWYMKADGVPPIPDEVAEQTMRHLDEIYEAVVNRDKDESLATIERLRVYLHGITW